MDAYVVHSVQNNAITPEYYDYSVSVRIPSVSSDYDGYKISSASCTIPPQFNAGDIIIPSKSIYITLHAGSSTVSIGWVIDGNEYSDTNFGDLSSTSNTFVMPGYTLKNFRASSSAINIGIQYHIGNRASWSASSVTISVTFRQYT